MLKEERNASKLAFLLELAPHVLDGTAGLDAIVESHPLLAIGVLPGAEDVLVALVVGSLVDHPHATLHSDGVAAVEVRVQVRTVSAAVVAAALELLVLVECDLQQRSE